MTLTQQIRAAILQGESSEAAAAWGPSFHDPENVKKRAEKAAMCERVAKVAEENPGKNLNDLFRSKKITAGEKLTVEMRLLAAKGGF